MVHLWFLAILAIVVAFFLVLGFFLGQEYWIFGGIVAIAGFIVWPPLFAISICLKTKKCPKLKILLERGKDWNARLTK